ncbi:pathogenesis-related leaf protein 6-like [Rosa rugosa]|uniref:SCP domain-containing protein n=1 Tax=Rosa chinensis TaxID=74649 RepID=A0A2P6PJX4_ROSCH|nr:pathogenesis-related leaf protein 6 [Rosa chinensis]XP_062024494.1 pathogenesis-related leaf protein 6-like [Rosa rugosa]PRQ22206.1 hypothetical protein RchiOBHm_Chr6g0247731 [Rosa chinensis]
MALIRLFLYVIGLVMVPDPSHVRDSPQDYLNVHNVARARVGVANIRWDNTVAAYALKYTKSRLGDCNLVHSGGPYGENLAKGSGSFTAAAAANMWVAEKPYYNYTSNACTGGKQCRHYTQVVWAKSVRVGCARLQCRNSWWFVTCSYYPPGNYIGQRPY